MAKNDYQLFTRSYHQHLLSPSLPQILCWVSGSWHNKQALSIRAQTKIQVLVSAAFMEAATGGHWAHRGSEGMLRRGGVLRDRRFVKQRGEEESHLQQREQHDDRNDNMRDLNGALCGWSKKWDLWRAEPWGINNMQKELKKYSAQKQGFYPWSHQSTLSRGMAWLYSAGFICAISGFTLTCFVNSIYEGPCHPKFSFIPGNLRTMMIKIIIISYIEISSLLNCKS